MDAITVEAGIDWITTTWVGQSLPVADVCAVLESIYGQNWRTEQMLDTWASLGYTGYQAGKARWGERHDGGIVIVSSADAQHYVECKGPVGQNVSRLDLQATFRVEGDVDLYITGLKQIAGVSRETLGGRWKISHIDGCGSGDTLYIGSRQSDVFFRIYNKAKQSEEDRYEQCVRWEIEYHGERAKLALEAVRSRRFSPGFILASIQAGFNSRGLDAPVNAVETTSAIPSPDRDSGPLQMKLKWLERQVRPSVRALLSCTDRDTILEALGLSEC